MGSELTIKRMYHLQPIPVLSSRATEVVWPIMVLKAKDIIVATETPFARVFISKISAGMIQDNGPQVALKEKLYTQVTTIKPQPAAPPPALSAPGGKLARRIVAMMKVMQLRMLPPIRGQRRPVRSMTTMQMNWAMRAMTEEIIWYRRVSSP